MINEFQKYLFFTFIIKKIRIFWSKYIKLNEEKWFHNEA
jgi:hypothetical protein